MLRILYIGHNHRINDPRLLYREMKLLFEEIDSIEFWFIKFDDFVQPMAAPHHHQIDIRFSEVAVNGIPVNLIHIRTNRSRFFGTNGLISTLFNRNIYLLLVNSICVFFADKEVNFIQASDVREIPLAIELGKRLKSKLIYDSHEDYVRQAIDYGHHSLKKYLKGMLAFCLELRYLRRFDHIFCTDEYLYKKYSSKIYSSREVTLLRNFPLVEPERINQRVYLDTLVLQLVYIGGVNENRGVIETAQYIERFNRTSQAHKLELTVYSPVNPIVEYLIENFNINHFPWVDYATLMAELLHYDVGTCLWLPIKKFYRNLPLKNFDYMACGLPIITSNFGQLTKYIHLSGAGVCINPLSYSEFENAIRPMFHGNYRKELGQNGFNWVQQTGNFKTEGRSYIETITREHTMRITK